MVKGQKWILQLWLLSELTLCLNLSEEQLVSKIFVKCKVGAICIFFVTDSALPTQPGEHILDENGQTHQDVEKVLNASDIGKFAKPYPTDVSLENPLLGLSPQEYLAFK